VCWLVLSLCGPYADEEERLAAAEVDADEYGGGDPLAMDEEDLEAAAEEALDQALDPLVHDTPGSR